MTLREFFLERLKAELPAFINVLKALPKDQLGYKPHERSPSAEQLVWTLTAEMKACLDVITEHKAEWQDIAPPPMEEMLEKYQQWSSELIDLVSKTDEASWNQVAQFYYQGKVVLEQPAGVLTSAAADGDRWVGLAVLRIEALEPPRALAIAGLGTVGPPEPLSPRRPQGRG